MSRGGGGGGGGSEKEVRKKSRASGEHSVGERAPQERSTTGASCLLTMGLRDSCTTNTMTLKQALLRCVPCLTQDQRKTSQPEVAVFSASVVVAVYDPAGCSYAAFHGTVYALSALFKMNSLFPYRSQTTWKLEKHSRRVASLSCLAASQTRPISSVDSQCPPTHSVQHALSSGSWHSSCLQ